MKFGSVCSGIEAASVAWKPLGWTAAWLAEIEPFPSAALAHHYPDVPNLGDMTKLPERIRSGEVEAPDVFCGGTPCQAFSVAGLRKSLDDARGNLSLTFCEIANEIDAVRSIRGDEPAIIFWENVPGVLSTKDNAFGCFLAGLAGEELALLPPGGKWTNAGCVLGPKRAVAWRVLDAQYFGVAQRRRRVFVVASARNGFDPAAVLFEFDGVRRDSPPSRESRQGIAGGVEIGPGGGRLTDLNPTLDTRAKDGPIRNQLAGAVMQPVAATLMSSFGRLLGTSGQDADHGHSHLVAFGGNNTAGAIDVAPCLNCNGGQRSGDFEAGALLLQQVTHSLRGEGFEASEDGTWRGTPIYTYSNAGEFGGLKEVAVSDPLRAKGGDTGNGGESLVCFHGTQDPCVSTTTAFSLGRNNSGENAIAFNPNQDGMGISSNFTPPIGASTGGGNQNCIAIRTAQTGSNGWGINTEGTAYTLDSAQQAVQTAMQVRRLTPVECERLQGFPDNYSRIPWRKKPAEDCPDGPRYKALGNSWAVPNVRWIGQRIVDHLAKRPT